MLLWQLSWLAAWCLGVRASEARLSRQTDRGGGNLIVQPSPSLMSVYPAIYPCVCLTDCWTRPICMPDTPLASKQQCTACSWVNTFQKVLLLCIFKRTNFLGKNKNSYLWITDVVAGFTSAAFPLSLSFVPRGSGCDNIRIMSWHVWRARDGSTECVCIWCGGRKLLYNEVGCQDMRWEVGSWRQDISYEKETNVRKCRGCCCCGCIS